MNIHRQCPLRLISALAIGAESENVTGFMLSAKKISGHLLGDSHIFAHTASCRYREEARAGGAVRLRSPQGQALTIA